MNLGRVAGWLGLLGLGCSSHPSIGQTLPIGARPIPPLAAFAADGSSALHPAWQVHGLAGKPQTPVTRFEPVMLDGEAVLRLRSDKSYGVLVHALPGVAASGQLSWRWRLEQALVQADIASKAGDDAALKVCVMFDQPLADIPFWQRAALRLARKTTGQDIPSATLCYLWDSRYPALTSGANPYTARVRYIVLDGPATPLGQWSTHRRRVDQDFLQLFGSESRVVPPVLAVAIGADSDNTQGHSLAYVSALHWLP